MHFDNKVVVRTDIPTQSVASYYCGQTAGWMKTPLGTEVDLRAGHIVLDGFPALSERGTAPLPLLGPCLLWPRSPISATAELLYILSFYYPVHCCISGYSVTAFHYNLLLSYLCLFEMLHYFMCILNTLHYTQELSYSI